MLENRDRYTNAVLTVIAACLLFQCAMLVGARLDAQSSGASTDRAVPAQAQPVVIVGWGEMSASGQIHLHMRQTSQGDSTDMVLPVRVSQAAQTPIPVAIAAPQPLPIVFAAPPQPMPVAITGIHNAFGQWDPINTRPEPQAPSALPGYPR